MKGPSLEAIRRFKEQQEKKKKEEDEKKIKEKLSILEFRASNGDRKAKQELKRLESIEQERNKAQQSTNNLEKKSGKLKIGQTISKNNNNQATLNSKQSVKAKKVETDFEELMRLAKQNTNEIKKPPIPEKKQEKPPKINHKNPPVPEKKQEKPSKINLTKPSNINQTKPSKINQTKPSQIYQKTPSQIYQKTPSQIYQRKPPVDDDYDYDDDDDDEDHYEADGFVVDDEEDDAQDELRKTLKSVFRYDRRRCDLREEELDREYRAIGRVSTYEDLEREERRASRLAAEEDARAQREEEEKKRMKKMKNKLA